MRMKNDYNLYILTVKRIKKLLLGMCGKVFFFVLINIKFTPQYKTKILHYSIKYLKLYSQNGFHLVFAIQN
jgi:hypothetical protein